MKKENSELISVIMSCYNENIAWVIKSIESILQQSYSNIEFIIVCDNPYYEELKKLLLQYKKKDPRIKLIMNEKNMGLVASLNLALKQCSGKYIARMDADDISHRDRFIKQIEVLQNKEADFVMSGAYYIDESGRVFKDTTEKKINYKLIKKYLKYRNISIHPTWMFKREILDKLGQYNDILYAEDYDFLCRAILEGYKVEYINEALIDYRVRKEGITRSKRYYQEITTQAVAESYSRALKHKEAYNPRRLIDNITNEEIENFRIQNEEFRSGKELIGKNKLFKGAYTIVKVLMKSPIKRRQAINHIRGSFVK